MDFAPYAKQRNRPRFCNLARQANSNLGLDFTDRRRGNPIVHEDDDDDANDADDESYRPEDDDDDDDTQYPTQRMFHVGCIRMTCRSPSAQVDREQHHRELSVA